MSVSLSVLCTQLDAWLRKESDGDYKEAGIDWQIEQSLAQMIQTFAVRWLPVLCPSLGGDNFVETVRAMWRHARRYMLRVINRPSYRSVLMLLLFGLTPVPAGVSVDEEIDGISRQVCVQSALQ